MNHDHSFLLLLKFRWQTGNHRRDGRNNQPQRLPSRKGQRLIGNDILAIKVGQDGLHIRFCLISIESDYFSTFVLYVLSCLFAGMLTV